MVTKKPYGPGIPLDVLPDGSMNIGTPDEMRVKLDQWRREQAATEKLMAELEQKPVTGS